MGVVVDFFRDLKDYRKRGLIYLLITIVVSVVISFFTWWFQQQTIDDLKFKLLTNQSNLQTQITSFEETTVSVPELQKITLQILDRIERKLISDEFKYEFSEFEPFMLQALCGFDSKYSSVLQSEMNMYYLQPFFQEYNLEPVLFVDSVLIRDEVMECFRENALNVIDIDSDIKMLVPSCYLPKLSQEDSVCVQFVREAFGVGQ